MADTSKNCSKKRAARAARLFFLRGGPLEITGGGKNFSVDEFFFFNANCLHEFFFDVKTLHDFFFAKSTSFNVKEMQNFAQFNTVLLKVTVSLES